MKCLVLSCVIHTPLLPTIFRMEIPYCVLPPRRCYERAKLLHFATLQRRLGARQPVALVAYAAMVLCGGFMVVFVVVSICGYPEGYCIMVG